MTDEPRTTNTFSMDCPTCGPGTIHFLDGEMVPHGCAYEPPSLVLRCEGDPMPETNLARYNRRRRSRNIAADVASVVLVAVAAAVALTPILWALVTFWRWVL